MLMLLKFKACCRDRTAHLVMSLLEFMQRLAVQVNQSQLQTWTTALRRSVSSVRCPAWVGCRCTLPAADGPLSVAHRYLEAR
jgi:hypothetical protein